MAEVAFISPQHASGVRSLDCPRSVACRKTVLRPRLAAPLSFCFALSVLALTIGTLPAQPVLLGDLDGDGQPTVIDLQVLLNHLSGTTSLAPALTPFADLNEDGTINTNDGVLLRDAILGLTPLPNPYSAPVVTAPVTATNGSSVLISGTARPRRRIVITGGRFAVFTTADSNGLFSAQVSLRDNQVNALFVTASNETFAAGIPQPLRVLQDAQPPSLFIDFPTNGATLYSSNTIVAGRVGDALSGFAGLMVNLQAPGAAGDLAAVVDVGLGNNGTYQRGNVPLIEGTNLIRVTATDIFGNTTHREITVVRQPLEGPRLLAIAGDVQKTNVHRRLAQPLVVRATAADGVTPLANRLVTLEVTRSDGRLSPVNASALADPLAFTNDINRTVHGVMRLALLTDGNGEIRAYWAMGGDAGCGNNRVCAMSEGISNAVYFCASADAALPKQINIGTGNNQKAETGGFVPEPLRAWVNDSCNGNEGLPVTFTVVQGDGKLYANSPTGPQGEGVSSIAILTARTGHAEVLLQLGPDAGQNVIEANYEGNPGLPATFIAYGVARDPARPTTLTGLVLDNTSQPIGGVTCTLSAGGQIFITTTDPQGRFVFDPSTLNAQPSTLPSGPAQLRVDGSTATNLLGTTIPTNSFPSLEFSLILIPNAENSLPSPVLLPRLNIANQRLYYGTNDLVLTCDGMEGLKMTIRAGSMHKPDGTLVTPGNPSFVSLNQVHHDSVPMPIPDGASPPFAWTLQPGGSTFDPPIQIEYPNMSGLPAGTIAYFLSYNHGTRRFEIICSGHVSEDSATILSDPGAGLTLAGWGCNCPPYSVTANCCKTPPDGCKKCENNKLVNEVDGKPADDGDDCTVNDRCQGGKAKGDPKDGGSSCDFTTGGAFITVYQETMKPTGGNTTSMTSVDVDGGACYDSASRSYRYHVNSKGHSGVINLTLSGSMEPIIGPFGTGNVTEDNYCAIIADMADYSSGGPGSGRGFWHTLDASRAHEEYHRDVDYKRIFDGRWPGAEAQLNGISVSCNNPFGRAIAQAMADAYICQFKQNVFADLNAFNNIHNAQTSDGAYQRGQIFLNERIREIQNYAISQFWAPCGAGLLGALGAGLAAAPLPRLTNLVVSPHSARLAAAQSVQADVIGQYNNGTVQSLTAAASGTIYRTDHPEVATVSPDGFITAVSPGFALITATISPGVDMLPLIATIDVIVTSPDDRDGDFMLDAWETAHGFNPNDPTDASQDADGDGLDNLHEFLRATDPHNPDTDGDGLPDGAEVEAGFDPLRQPILDDHWRVSVNGQSVQVNPDGSFTVPNVSAPDLFGPGGPGTRPDFLSDDFVRLTGQATILGKTYYVFSEPFQFRAGQTFDVTNLTLTQFPPPLPESLRATPDSPVLVGVGQTTQVRVTATMKDGAETDVTPRQKWTVYRTSNPAIATVDADGLVTGLGKGKVFIIAANQGASSVCQIDVVPDDPLTTVRGTLLDTNGVPVAGVSLNFTGLATAPVVSSADGSFLFTNVPTLFGPLHLVARLVGTNSAFFATAILNPVLGGITEAGSLTLKQGVAWIGVVSGVWHGATNWSNGVIPGPDSDVFIAADPGVTVTVSQGANVANNLVLFSPLRLGGGSLRVQNIIEANSPIQLAGGKLLNSIVDSSGVGIQATTTAGTLDGVVLNGDVDVQSGTLNVTNGLVLHGLMRVGQASGSSGSLYFQGSQALGGSGTVLLGSHACNSLRLVFGNTTLTNRLWIHGQNGQLGYSTCVGGPQNVGLVNEGTIAADVAGGSITLRAQPLRNAGQLLAGPGTLHAYGLTGEVGLAAVSTGGHLDLDGTYTNNLALPVSGGTLTLNGDWFNGGQLLLTNSVLNLDGTFTLGDLGSIIRVGGTVRVTGLLNGPGDTLTLNAATGNWIMSGGTLRGLTISSTDGALLQASTTAGTLDGVVLNGDVDVQSGTLNVTNGLVLHGLMRVGQASGSAGSLYFQGSQALSGSGTVLLGSHACNSLRLVFGNTTLTNRLWIHGQNGQLGYSTCVGGPQNVGLVNEGTISADVNLGTLTIRAQPFINFGTTNQLNGGRLVISP